MTPLVHFKSTFYIYCTANHFLGTKVLETSEGHFFAVGRIEVNVPIMCQYQFIVPFFQTPIARDLLTGKPDCPFVKCWW